MKDNSEMTKEELIALGWIKRPSDKMQEKAEKQLTAVEFYAEGLENLHYNTLEKNGYDNAKQRLLEKAKEIEKERMLNAFQESRLTHPMIGFKHETFVDYYKQTFKSE